MQESQYKIEQIGVETLAKAWLNAPQTMKQEVLQNLKDTLLSQHSLQNEKIYLRCEYFLYDSHYIDLSIHESELSEIVNAFSKMNSASRVVNMCPKLKECMDLIVNLF